MEADEVDRGCGEGVLKADFVEAGVPGLMDTSGCGDLVDGAFDSGAGAVDLFPGMGLLFGPGVPEGFMEVAGS